MAGISVAEGPKRRREPKEVGHLEIHPAMKSGGHRIEAHHTSFEHPKESEEFGPDDHKGFYGHIAKLTGRPHPMIGEEEGDEPEPIHPDKERG